LEARSTTTTARVSQSQRSRPGMINVFVLLVLLLVTSGAKAPSWQAL